MSKIHVWATGLKVVTYEVDGLSKAHAHARAILAHGFRHGAKHGDEDVIDYYPPSTIIKVRIEGKFVGRIAQDAPVDGRITT